MRGGEEKKSPLTLGKVIGSVAFVISEFLVMLATTFIIVAYFFSGEINWDFFASLFVFQGSVLVTTWGCKASSNFARKEINSYEDERSEEYNQ